MTRYSTLHGLIFACVLGSLIADPVRAAISVADTARINQILETSAHDYRVASVTAEVRAHGEVIYAKSFGYANLENDVPATPQGLYAIGSITKSLTSFTILNLVSQGKLQLSSKLGDVLPDYKGPARVVTILQLLTHTSGIPDYAGDSTPPLFGDARKEYTEQEVVDLFKARPLVFRPGTRWQYSNSGYYMLSLVIEKVTGKPYGDAVREILLKPFGLSQIMLGRLTPIIKKRVTGYTINSHGQMENALTCGSVLPLGAGAYLASADDLTRYVADLFSDSVPAAVHQMMFHAISLADGTNINYLPAALVETNVYGHKQFAHAGGYWGFRAYVAYYPEDKVAIAVLTNTDSLESQKDNLPNAAVSNRIARVIFHVSEPKIVDLTLSAPDAQAFVGTYRLPEFISSSDTVRFFYSGGSLWMKVGSGTRANWYARDQSVKKGPGQETSGASQLLYQGDGRFVEKDNQEAQVAFSGRSAGHLDVHVGSWFIGRYVGSNTPAR